MSDVALDLGALLRARADVRAAREPRDERAGVAFGVVGAVLIPMISDTRVELSVSAGLVAIAVAMGIGMIFGVYPATRAARLAPIDALRSE